MIIDTSVLIAILRDEADARLFTDAIDSAHMRRISVATFVEAASVVDANRNPILSRQFDQLIDRVKPVIEPVTEEQARIARDAYRDFGNGSGHPAQLNFGDCFSYALAKATGEPLLFKGRDFAQTDIASVLS